MERFTLGCALIIFSILLTACGQEAPEESLENKLYEESPIEMNDELNVETNEDLPIETNENYTANIDTVKLLEIGRAHV